LAGLSIDVVEELMWVQATPWGEGAMVDCLEAQSRGFPIHALSLCDYFISWKQLFTSQILTED
jgi:hypothetical protein